MSLATVIGANFAQTSSFKPKPRRALVLMGGGARTAYQVGVLKGLAGILGAQAAATPWPLQLLVGTSAGALNSAFLASRVDAGLGAFDQLAEFWRGLRSDAIYELNIPGWMRYSRVLTALGLTRRASEVGGVMDNLQLIDSLHKAIRFEAIESNLKQGKLQALAVTASSYTSGLHWTFCQRAPGLRHLDSTPRAGRRIHEEPITIDHLAASSAIPLIFPAASLFVDGRREFFGDGSMRHMSPLSAPMKLGATHILAIGAAQPERAGLVGGSAPTKPSLGMVAGHAMASVFHDTLRADVEQAQRVNESLERLPPEMAQAAGYKPVKVLQVTPSRSLDAFAVEHMHELPRPVRNALAGLGGKGESGAALASYLLFEPGFTGALMQLGERDAYAHKEALLAFFSAS